MVTQRHHQSEWVAILVFSSSPRQQKIFPPFLHSLFRHFSGDFGGSLGGHRTIEHVGTYRLCGRGAHNTVGGVGQHFRIGKRDTDYGGTLLPGHLCRTRPWPARKRSVCCLIERTLKRDWGGVGLAEVRPTERYSRWSEYKFLMVVSADRVAGIIFV